MNEQLPPEVAPPEEEITPPPEDLAEAVEPVERRGRSGWIAPAWFFFGIIVGIAGFAAYNALIVKPPAFDPTAMRAVARDGMLEAIATLQAGGPAAAAPQQEPQGPQAVANNTFTVRDTNRQGNPNATVTVYEFSDFQ